jgi:hypothetical protein
MATRLSGLYADIPEPSACVNGYYYAVDQKIVYRSLTDAWIARTEALDRDDYTQLIYRLTLPAEPFNFLGALVYVVSENKTYEGFPTAWAHYNPSGGEANESAEDLAFNGNRVIKRAGLPQVMPGGETVPEFLEKLFYPYVSAIISGFGASPSLAETGSSQSVILTGSIAANDDKNISRYIVATGNGGLIHAPIANNFNYVDPGVTTTKNYRLEVVTETANPISGTAGISFIHPFFWGVSDQAELNGNALYSSLTKSLTTQGNKTVKYNAAAQYLYFAYPAFYPNLTRILDPNGFDVTGSFDLLNPVSVEASGLLNNWTTNYKVYRTATPTNVGGQNFQFQF